LNICSSETGYDVPEVRVAIILATSSNRNQIVQRIGKTLRKIAGKDTALIYATYLSHTHDFGTLKMVRRTLMPKPKILDYVFSSFYEFSPAIQASYNIIESSDIE